MKIIKEFQITGMFLSKEMKHIQYDFTDADSLKKRFTKLESDTVDKLCNWLKENNSVVDAIDCYDAQSGWHGTDFMIGKANLSLNGYCLSNSAVEEFINGEQNPMWYRFYEPEYQVAKTWVLNNKKNNSNSN